MTAPAIADFSTALARGIALFNEQQFFEAHEVWEDRWRVETGGPSRDAGRTARALLLHGLIQVAAGFVKWQRGEPRGMVSLLAKGAAKLEQVRGDWCPIDVERLLAAVSQWRQAGQAMPDAGRTGHHPAPLPRLDPAWSRGGSARIKRG